ncbi:MAG: chemotaxis protein CheW [FCB group bacterium]|jgi:purine-binding chemotaxis protein CheW|nr:chemotaxis protein CheW [FCB group bacterium]
MQVETRETAGSRSRAEAGKYLTFLLAGEYFGLGILRVQEIIGMMPVTKVPRSPEFVRGVINLRGRIIPVMDLRRKFGDESQDDTERTCIIVVQVQDEDSRLTIGLLVDEVSEVINVQEEQIEPPPSFGTRVDADFILGIGKVGEKVVILLDVDRVLTNHEANLIGEVAERL